MARQRRGGFRTPELRGTLGTLLRTTLEQAGVVRDAIAGTARSRLDEARSHRRRQESLAELGEIVLDLVQRGEIDVEELPEARAVIRQLEALDADPDDDREARTTSVRHRFDDRGHDDGTVGRTWAPPHRAQTPTQVWRPTGERGGPEGPGVARDDGTADQGRASTRSKTGQVDAQSASGPASPRPKPAPPQRPGGISFEDDDLADYMHPDDVPSKDPTDGDA